MALYVNYKNYESAAQLISNIYTTEEQAAEYSFFKLMHYSINAAHLAKFEQYLKDNHIELSLVAHWYLHRFEQPQLSLPHNSLLQEVSAEPTEQSQPVSTLSDSVLTAVEEFLGAFNYLTIDVTVANQLDEQVSLFYDFLNATEVKNLFNRYFTDLFSNESKITTTQEAISHNCYAYSISVSSNNSMKDTVCRYPWLIDIMLSTNRLEAINTLFNLFSNNKDFFYEHLLRSFVKLLSQQVILGTTKNYYSNISNYQAEVIPLLHTSTALVNTIALLLNKDVNLLKEQELLESMIRIVNIFHTNQFNGFAHRFALIVLKFYSHNQRLFEFNSFYSDYVNRLKIKNSEVVKLQHACLELYLTDMSEITFSNKELINKFNTIYNYVKSLEHSKPQTSIPLPLKEQIIGIINKFLGQFSSNTPGINLYLLKIAHRACSDQNASKKLTIEEIVQAIKCSFKLTNCSTNDIIGEINIVCHRNNSGNVQSLFSKLGKNLSKDSFSKFVDHLITLINDNSSTAELSHKEQALAINRQS